MIIRSIKLHNFGVYLNDNIFSFSSEKPIVLIGGMNGHGKTTFLEAILLGLYGSNSPSYKEKKRVTYNSYLKSYINRMSTEKAASIELNFDLNDHDSYSVTRAWHTEGRTVKEDLYVKHNGTYDDFLTKNWSMFIENLVPNALSKFFFFDGEKIVEMAMDTNNVQVKESIKAMLGINVLDVLSSDLNKILRKLNAKAINKDILHEISNKKELKLSLSNELNDLKSQKEEVELQVYSQQEKIEKLHNKYTVSGGQAIEKRQSLMQQKANLETLLDTLNNLLVEASSTCIPLKMVESLLLEIKMEAVDEHTNSIMSEVIDLLKIRLDEYEQANISSEEVVSINKFFNYIEDGLEDKKQFYNLSNQAINQIEELVESKLAKEIEVAKDLIGKKNETIEELNRVNSYLEIDINKDELSNILKQIEKEENNLYSIQNKLGVLESNIANKETEFNRTSGELSKITESYLSEVEASDDSERKIKYIHMSLALVEKYKVRLQNQKVIGLASTITECYNKLANKQKLIRQIKIDPDTLDITYYTEEGHEIDKMSLSAGEKQLAVISTLWALAICSKNKLPVIIDTPLARLDSKHRESLVTNYFPFASEQTMILSTDSEIDHNYYDMMKDYIGDEYILKYNEDTRSTVVKEGYFNGGMKND